MKQLFLLVGTFSFGTLLAQENNFLDLEKNLKRFNQKLKKPAVIIPPHEPIHDLNLLPVSKQATLAEVLPNGNKLYILPQDNMPCIVPDMNNSNMPNAATNKGWLLKQQNQIPNAWHGTVPLIPQDKNNKNK